MAKNFTSEKDSHLVLDGTKVFIKIGENLELHPNKVLIGGIYFDSNAKRNLELENLLSEKKSETLEKIYLRYDYLAVNYANKLWNNSDSAIEKSDLIQELRIRLFTSVKAYAVKWNNYKENGGARPIPLEFYLKTVMINKSRDLIKELNSNSHVSIDELGLQFGTTALEVSAPDKINVFLGSQNLIEMFSGQQKTFMQLYFLSDFDKEKVMKRFKGEGRKWVADKIISKGVEKIKNYLTNDVEDAQDFYYFELQD